MFETNSRITEIKGVGEASAKRFEKLNVRTVGELINHFPFRYESYGLPVDITAIGGEDIVAVEGMVDKKPVIMRTPKGTIIEMQLRDRTGTIGLRWYNSPFIMKQVKQGVRLIFRGRVVEKQGRRFLAHPEVFTREKYLEMLKSLKPVYPSTTSLNQTTIRKTMRSALEGLVLKDYLPAGVVKENELPSLLSSYEDIHFPKDEKSLGQALGRIVFDEFFSFFGHMRRLKADEIIRPNEKHIAADPILDEITAGLGWPLTGDQMRALDEIMADVSGDTPMQRLLQGDVGSGKTVIALLLLAVTVRNGYQGCIMAPTEVLADQHYEYFTKMLAPYGINVILLKGSMSAAAKRRALDLIKSGEADIVVGTHAAIQSGVEYKDLAVAVIDEQHRFGVKQREALELKGSGVHLLLMSATPIPRTYALMLYGNMDISALKELPSGRKPIKNMVGDESMRRKINEFLVKEIRAGHQVYVICPLIEESEKLEAEAVTEYVERLRQLMPLDIRIEMLSGRMKADEKTKVMDDFSAGEIDILVSTTVIEVGINVPNASVMIIENAERFGLAQLHQIRGRVGRGKDQSYCIFMNSKKNDAARERLDIIAKSNDGFYVAEQDMRLRGPGDFFGVRQSGEQQFVLADPLRDGEILKKASDAVAKMDAKTLAECLERRNAIVNRYEYMVY